MHLMEKVHGVLVMTFARNVMIFGADNSLSSHTDNLIKDFLILSEGDTFRINGSFGAPEK